MIFSRPQLRVFSAVFSNLAVLWIGALFVTNDFFALTTNLVYAILSLYIALRLEERIEEL